MRAAIPLAVIVFGITFGFIESAVVVYLRYILGITQPVIGKGEVVLSLPGLVFLEPQTALQIFKNVAILNVEKIREIATLVILIIVAFLPSRSWKDWVAFFFLAFGIWDIFYYIFLRAIVGWPNTLSDWDLFFLWPLPWAGPVFVPIGISTALVISSLVYLFLKTRKLSREK